MCYSRSILCINNMLHNRSTLQRGLFSDKLILWLYTRVRMCMCGHGWQWPVRRSNTAFNLTLIKTPKLIRLESVAIVRTGWGGYAIPSSLLFLPLFSSLFSSWFSCFPVFFRFIFSSSPLLYLLYFLLSSLPIPFLSSNDVWGQNRVLLNVS